MAGGDLADLGAAAAAAEIARGAVTAEELATACLARADAREGRLRAFARLDRDYVLAQARARDEERREGRAIGPLHGVPVAVKDIFDTADLATECGSPLLAGRLPWEDAAAVAALRAAGAVVFGKAATTEFAYFHPGPTRNPHDPERTPGGSSSGSAAAVAAGIVPLALGSQTNGSTIRPAAFCGVVGFKPTHGLVPRTGMFRLSRTLDHVGVFARGIEDAALLAEALAGHHAGDPDTRPRARPPLRATAMGPWPLPPRLAFVRSPAWDAAEPETREAFAELVAALGGAVTEVALGPEFAEALSRHRTVMEAEMAHNLAPLYERGKDRFSPALRAAVERGRAVGAFEYQRALAGIAPLNESFAGLFDEYNAVLTPAAPGPAPLGLDSTGDPIFCTLWTYLGVPAVTLPLMQSQAGLPLGVQLVGPRGDDARLLRAARWLSEAVAPGRTARRGRRAAGAALAAGRGGGRC